MAGGRVDRGRKTRAGSCSGTGFGGPRVHFPCHGPLWHGFAPAGAVKPMPQPFLAWVLALQRHSTLRQRALWHGFLAPPKRKPVPKAAPARVLRVQRSVSHAADRSGTETESKGTNHRWNNRQRLYCKMRSNRRTGSP